MKIFKYIVGLFLAILFYGEIGVSAQEMNLECAGTFKSIMPMTALSKSSPQYKYLATETTDKDNLRITSDGYYAVAMGSYYGKLGDKFVVTFSNGQTTKVVKVDEKADAHTVGGRGMCMASDGSIIEPILTTGDPNAATNPKLLREVYFHGNAGRVYSLFAGEHKITSIRKVTGQSRSEKPTYTELDTSAVRLDPEREEILSRFTYLEGNMILHLPKVKQDKIVFLDTEFMEGRKLVQAAFIIFDRIDDSENFFLTNSLNLYVNTPISDAFSTFTGINAGFLGNNGVPFLKAHEILDSFVEENKINKANTLLVGHGLQQDINVLFDFGCPLTADTYDTHQMGRVLLKRDCNLKLSDLLLDAGLVHETSHDAYQDARNLIPVFSYLVWVDYKKEEG